MMRGLVLVALIGHPLMCQTRAKTPQPAALASAIERLRQTNLKPDPRVLALTRMLNKKEDVCSVPLIRMRIENPESYAVSRVQPPDVDPGMPRTQGPAPACPDR